MSDAAAPVGRATTAMSPVSEIDRRLYLVRHAETNNVGPDGSMHCRTPMPLTERGRAQADALGEYFAEIDVSAVYASDIPRAAETAERLARGRPVVLREGLCEISLGDYDGATVETIFSICPGFLSDPEATLPGGESLLEVADRVASTIEEILATDNRRDVVVVAHGATNRAVLAPLLGLPVERVLHLRQDWAAVNIVDFAAGRWWLGTYNWNPGGVREFEHTRLTPGITPELWERMGR